VLPERVAKDLPAAVGAIHAQGLAVPMASTAITRAGDPHAEAIVAECARQGVRLLKLGYWPPQKGRVREAADHAPRRRGGRERRGQGEEGSFGIDKYRGRGYVNCQPVVVGHLLRDRDPKRFASYFDPGHAAVEGGNGGWRQNLELLAPHIRLIAVKDFAW